MTKRLGAWGPAAVWAAVLFFLSALPGLDRPPILFSGEDKVVHAALYAVLGATLAWGGRHRAARPPSWVPLLLGVLYGVSDEWHQSFVAGRDPSTGDWVADTVGVVLGYWIATTMLRRQVTREAGHRPHVSTPGSQSE